MFSLHILKVSFDPKLRVSVHFCVFLTSFLARLLLAHSTWTCRIINLVSSKYSCRQYYVDLRHLVFATSFKGR